jgi:hypothetical protein
VQELCGPGHGSVRIDLCKRPDVAFAMADAISPSPIIKLFVNEVHATFPESESSKIAGHEDSIAKSTSDGDHHRARMCLRWAIKMADDKKQEHPRWQQLKERHQIWKDEAFALEFGVADATYGSGTHHEVGKAEPLEDVRIEWVENAVRVARVLGEEDGWENSPWEALLVALIDFKRN